MFDGTVQLPRSSAHFTSVLEDDGAGLGAGAGAGDGALALVLPQDDGTRVEADTETFGEDALPDQDMRAPSPMPSLAKARHTRQSSLLSPAASRPSRMSRKVGPGWVWFSPSMTRSIA